MKLGIIGLEQAGKTTVFEALTGAGALFISPAPALSAASTRRQPVFFERESRRRTSGIGKISRFPVRDMGNSCYSDLSWIGGAFALLEAFLATCSNR